MIHLPDSMMTGTVALLLGLVSGAGAYHLLSGSSSTRLLTEMEQEGIVKINRDRALAPRDTTGQSKPDVEVRFDTVRVTDTVTVGVPQSLADDPVVSSRTPISVTQDRVRWTYWDPADSRWEQRLWAVPQPTWSLDVNTGVGVTLAPLTGRVRSGAATSTLGVNRHWDDTSLRLGLGAAVTTDRVGWVATLTVTRTLLSR